MLVVHKKGIEYYAKRKFDGPYCTKTITGIMLGLPINICPLKKQRNCLMSRLPRPPNKKRKEKADSQLLYFTVDVCNVSSAG